METLTQYAPDGVPMSEAIDLFRRNRSTGPKLPDPHVEAAIERGRQFVRDGLPRCESPIEQQLLPWLVFGLYGDMPGPVRVGSPGEAMAVGANDMVIVPQFEFYRFRLDFALFARRRDGAAKMIAVECDGFAFHDVRKDAERDAYLLEHGVITERGYGTDIFRKPYLVAERVARHFCAWSYHL